MDDRDLLHGVEDLEVPKDWKTNAIIPIQKKGQLQTATTTVLCNASAMPSTCSNHDL